MVYYDRRKEIPYGVSERTDEMDIAKIILAVATTVYLITKIVATIQDQIDKHNKK